MHHNGHMGQKMFPPSPPPPLSMDTTFSAPPLCRGKTSLAGEINLFSVHYVEALAVAPSSGSLSGS